MIKLCVYAKNTNVLREKNQQDIFFRFRLSRKPKERFFPSVLYWRQDVSATISIPRIQACTYGDFIIRVISRHHASLVLLSLLCLTPSAWRRWVHRRGKTCERAHVTSRDLLSCILAACLWRERTAGIGICTPYWSWRTAVGINFVTSCPLIEWRFQCLLLSVLWPSEGLQESTSG